MFFMTGPYLSIEDRVDAAQSYPSILDPKSKGIPIDRLKVGKNVTAENLLDNYQNIRHQI
jgi:hypothetical protein